jgi:Putative zinc- or iron-chelating domain
MADESPRRERRALPLLDDALLVTSSRYTPEVLAGIALHEAAVLAPVITRDVSGAIEAVAIASARTEQLVTEALQDEPPALPIACASGCSTCCQAKVLVLAPEVLRVGAHLRQTKTTDALATLLERVREADAITRGLSRAERAEAHVFCPLLDGAGACSIHEVRPLVCRSWTSYDAQACGDYWRAPSGRLTPPQWGAGYELAQAMMAGLGKACLDRGLDGLPLEFISALRIVLERPNAGERWLKKLPVFMPARDREWAEANGRV